MMRSWQKVEIAAHAVKGDPRQKISSGGEFESVFGYSRAIKIGNQVHISGSCAAAGHENSNVYKQSVAIFETIGKALSEAGSSFDEVVRTVVYLRDINDAGLVARAHGEVFRDVLPTSTLIQVVSMMRPWQKVEIEAYATSLKR